MSYKDYYKKPKVIVKEQFDFKVLLDVDSLNKLIQSKYTKEEWSNICQEKYRQSDYVKYELYEKGLISKIHFNRFRRGIYQIFDWTNNTPNIMPVGKFNELFDVKPINIPLFQNSVRKIDKALKEISEVLK